MAIHSSILAWKISWTEEPRAIVPWGHKESDRTETSEHSTHSKILWHWRRTLPNPRIISTQAFKLLSPQNVNLS